MCIYTCTIGAFMLVHSCARDCVGLTLDLEDLGVVLDSPPTVRVCKCS